VRVIALFDAFESNPYLIVAFAAPDELQISTDVSDFLALAGGANVEMAFIDLTSDVGLDVLLTMEAKGLTEMYPVYAIRRKGASEEEMQYAEAHGACRVLPHRSNSLEYRMLAMNDLGQWSEYISKKQRKRANHDT